MNLAPDFRMLPRRSYTQSGVQEIRVFPLPYTLFNEGRFSLPPYPRPLCNKSARPGVNF